MFEILAFVYENYDAGQSLPETAHLEKKLSALGFETDEIHEALTWLRGLDCAAQPLLPLASIEPWPVAPSTNSMRIYTPKEQSHLGREGMGLIAFMEYAADLPAPMREVVVERAMAAPAATGGSMALDDLKTILLLVYWRFGEELHTLMRDELCDDTSDRVAH